MLFRSDTPCLEDRVLTTDVEVPDRPSSGDEDGRSNDKDNDSNVRSFPEETGSLLDLELNHPTYIIRIRKEHSS